LDFEIVVRLEICLTEGAVDDDASEPAGILLGDLNTTGRAQVYVTATITERSIVPPSADSPS
jgi:hypothetical protein